MYNINIAFTNIYGVRTKSTHVNLDDAALQCFESSQRSSKPLIDGWLGCLSACSRTSKHPPKQNPGYGLESWYAPRVPVKAQPEPKDIKNSVKWKRTKICIKKLPVATSTTMQRRCTFFSVVGPSTWIRLSLWICIRPSGEGCYMHPLIYAR